MSESGSEERTVGAGAATLSKEQIELIGLIVAPMFDRLEAKLRLAIKEEVERVRVEMKEEVRQQIQTQSKHFYWVIGVLVTIWLAAATLVVNKWPSGAVVAPAVGVAHVAPVEVGRSDEPVPDEPVDLGGP